MAEIQGRLAATDADDGRLRHESAGFMVMEPVTELVGAAKVAAE